MDKKKSESCGNYVEIHPTEPGGADVWRLEMHDNQGRTMSPGERVNPDADCLRPDMCERCSADSFSLKFENACIVCMHQIGPETLGVRQGNMCTIWLSMGTNLLCPFMLRP